MVSSAHSIVMTSPRLTKMMLSLVPALTRTKDTQSAEEVVISFFEFFKYFTFSPLNLNFHILELSYLQDSRLAAAFYPTPLLTPVLLLPH